MLEELPGLHNPDDGGLEVHLPVLLDRVVGSLNFLNKNMELWGGAVK